MKMTPPRVIGAPYNDIFFKYTLNPNADQIILKKKAFHLLITRYGRTREEALDLLGLPEMPL